MAARLQLRQTQALVMTPQLMQSIRLLQFSHLELERFVDEEIERNPLLERVLRDEDSFEQPGPAVDEAAFAAPHESAEDIAGRLDTSLENIFPDDPGRGERMGPDLNAQWRSAPPPTGDAPDIGELTPSRPTFRDHVAAQIAHAFPDVTQRAIATALANDLDETGYCDCDLALLGRTSGAGLAVAQAVLERCQGFDPPGIFARNLAECLALQLAVRDRLDPAMRALLSRLDLLARRDFATLKRLCGVDEEDLLAMLGEIRTLDPKPGLAFAGGVADIIVPDVVVRLSPDGGWAVELNPDTLPRVLVDETYYTHIAKHAKNQTDREFLSRCMQSANWLTRSLDQRARTILKVTAEIVRQQDAFLVEGVTRLRPLNLRAVADAIGMHESTVSRVTANKYVMTPRGVFELRYFFNAAIASAEGGDAHSSEAVRHRIRALIERESAEILSDDAIVDQLRESGVDIARRTVAKYREGMNIPSSVQRRREKRAAGVSERSVSDRSVSDRSAAERSAAAFAAPVH